MSAVASAMNEARSESSPLSVVMPDHFFRGMASVYHFSSKIHLLTRGESEELERLLHQHRKVLQVIIRRFGGRDRDEFESAFFVHLAEQFHRFDASRSAFPTWATMRAFATASASSRRRKRRSRFESGCDAPDVPDTGDEFAVLELVDAIERLHAEHRGIIKAMVSEVRVSSICAKFNLSRQELDEIVETLKRQLG